MSDELKELPKEEGGIFSRVGIVLSKIHPPHTVSLRMPAVILQCLFCHEHAMQ